MKPLLPPQPLPSPPLSPSTLSSRPAPQPHSTRKIPLHTSSPLSPKPHSSTISSSPHIASVHESSIPPPPLRERRHRNQPDTEKKPFNFDIKWGRVGDSKRVLARKFRKLQYRAGRNQFSATNIKVIKKLVNETNETIKKRKQTFNELPYREKLAMRKKVEKTTTGLSPDDKRKLKGMIRKGM